MFASLLRPKKRRVYAERSPFSSPCGTREESPFFRNQGRGNDSRTKYEEQDLDDNHGDEHEETGDDDEDGEDDNPHDSTPLLPIFSASHLGIAFIHSFIYSFIPKTN